MLVGVPADYSAECGDAPAPADVTATDNCDDNLEVVYEEVMNNTECPISITRTWTVTDHCGNSVSASQNIEINDTTNPELVDVPEDATVECDDIPAAAAVTATDNCDEDVQLDYTEEEANVTPCTYDLVRTWTATDDCDNTVTATQVLTVVDTTDPIVTSVPADVTIECDEEVPSDNATFSDNCDDNLDISMISGIDNETACSYDVVKTWTATDNCGNSTSVSQTITVEDTTAPMLFGVPVDETLECDETPADAIVTATDNCDDELTVALSTDTEDLACGSIMTRTWTVADDCGNTTSATQTITFEDTTAPVIAEEPQDITLECDQQDPGFTPEWSDNCDDDLELTSTSAS